MVRNTYLVLLLGVAALLCGCRSDNPSTGEGLLRDEEFQVFSDTTSLGSNLYACSSVVSSPDSFLLGEMQTPHGTVQADILTQVACPVGFRYPEGSEMDSVSIYLYYSTWTGDGNSPLEIDIREMDPDRAELSYTKLYHTDIEISDYCDLTTDANRILENKRIVSVSKGDSISGRKDVKFVRLKADPLWAETFFARQTEGNGKNMATLEDFNKVFHGLYITTTFGGGSVMHLSDIALAVHYHFSYEKTVVVGDHYIKQDTTVSDSKHFYANAEVRQVNRIRHFGSDGQPSNYAASLAPYDSLRFVVSPAGVYTRIGIPVRSMATSIFNKLYVPTELRYRRPYVNLAKMRVNVLNYYEGVPGAETSEDWAQPAKNMLLIKEDSMQIFFSERLLPREDMAILGTLTNAVDSLGENAYYYQYDLSWVLTQSLREAFHDTSVTPETLPDTLYMVMVPVNVQTSSSSTYGSTTIGVYQQQTISNTIIASETNKKQPLSLEVVYSGF